MKFTERGLQALKAKDKRYDMLAEDTRGLGVRIFPTGGKSFFFRYQKDGRRVRLTIGPYPEITLRDARVRVGEYWKKLHNGIDPAAEEQKRKAELVEAPTVKELTELYIERYAKQKKRSWREDQRMLNKDVIPVWGKRKAQDIRRRDVIALLDGIVDRGSAIAANRTFEVIRRMFNFAVERDILEGTPCLMVKPPGMEAQCDRVLAPREIRTFWRRLYHTDMTPLLRMALKFMLVTAQRRGEVTAARWDDIDFSESVWTILETKNSLPHRVPLSPLALRLLSHIHRVSGQTPWLFPNPPLTGSVTERAPTRGLSRNLQALEIEHFTPRDLRRTAASQMAAAGVPRIVIGKVLNHVETGVTAVYDRHSYDPEKRQALDLWGGELLAILGKSFV